MFNLPVAWYAIAALVLTNAASFGMWRYDAGKLDDIYLQQALDQAEATRVIDKQKQITEDTTNGWKAALDSVRSFNAKRVLPKPAEAGGISIPAASVDGAGSDPIPSASRVAEDCAFATLTVNQLQDWVRKQEEATK